jgi:hypothetical protein
MAKKTVSRTLVLNLPALEDVPSVVHDLLSATTKTKPVTRDEVATIIRMTETVLEVCLEATQNDKTDTAMAFVLRNLPALEDVPSVVRDLLPRAITKTLTGDEVATIIRMTEKVVSVCHEASQNDKIDVVMATMIHTFVAEVR